MAEDPRPRVLVLGGPTAAGKTEASLEVARRWGAVVLSADAMQVYRYMDIGTAKAPIAERQGILHEGIDVVDPDEAFDASDFTALADRVLAEHPRVVVAGGTSFYLRAMQRGLVWTPEPDAAIREALAGIEDLHGELARVDPALAAKLHPHDRVRLVRGVEVFRQTGERLSDLQAAHAAEPDRVQVVGRCLDRDDLDARIDARAEGMIAAGYVQEVQGLLDRGFGPDLKPMRSLGYRHMCDHLLEGLPLEEAVRRTQRDTRRFARKQRTWMNTLQYPTVRQDHVAAALEAAHEAFGEP